MHPFYNSAIFFVVGQLNWHCAVLFHPLKNVNGISMSLKFDTVIFVDCLYFCICNVCEINGLQTLSFVGSSFMPRGV